MSQRTNESICPIHTYTGDTSLQGSLGGRAGGLSPPSTFGRKKKINKLSKRHFQNSTFTAIDSGRL